MLAVTFPPPTLGGYALTLDWVHLDLVFHRRSTCDAEALSDFVPIFGDLRRGE